MSKPQPLSAEATRVLQILTNGTPHREVYLAAHSYTDWWITYSGGQAQDAAVRELINAGLIVPIFSSSGGCYHVGKTLDMEATQAARAKVKDRKMRIAIRIYTDGTSEGLPKK